MLTYILECVAFQLICLLVYDLFLKKETFFQWNRAFLIVSYLLSLVLPWVKIEALKTTVSKEAVYYPANWFVQIEGVAVGKNATVTGFWEHFSAWEWTYICGILGMAVWLVVKLYKIRKLHQKGFKTYYPAYTRVTVQKSNVAFSFFKSIFMGDALPKNKEQQILEHELVHIKQWHSLDLFFFELMRIAFWFNPLVYVYQNRISELHEFIADAKVAKYQRKEQYSILLSQAFKTENISFINQFFTQSLIKKRIVMLSKQKSKRIFQLKYILLIPIVLGMLVYTSCEEDRKVNINEEQLVGDNDEDQDLIDEIRGDIIKTKNESDDWFLTMMKEVSNEIEVSENGNLPISKKTYFAQSLLMYELMSTSNDENHEYILPNTAKYNDYINSWEVFQLLDEDLKTSLRNTNYSIRLVKKKDSNLGQGDWINVMNVKDLSSSEINEIKRALKINEGTKRNVVLLDDNFSFLIEEKDFKFLNPVITNFIFHNEKVPFSVIDQVPVFPGCESAADKRACFQENIQNHIRKHFNYPLEAQEQNIQGRVSIMITIQEDGTIGNIEKRGPHALLENEAVRIIERLPKMEPGKHKGKVVSVPFAIPITFRLQEENGIDNAIAQFSKIDTNWVPFRAIENPPVFPGCEDAVDARACFSEKMINHVKKHFNYPQEAKEKGIQGRVAIMFVINTKGEIIDIQKRGPSPILEAEAERIIKRLPKMQPASNNGELADVAYSIPITFKL